MLGAGVLLALLGVLIAALVALFAASLAGEDAADLWREIALPLIALGVMCGLLGLAALGAALVRIRNRRRRPLARYQLVLSQADEAPLEGVATAYEQLVQAVRASLAGRVVAGQPWLALESWFLPAQRPGETGTAALMLLCEPGARDRALAALRHAYPDLALRPDPSSDDGAPLEFVQPRFTPGHVMRVRKARSWVLPLGPSRQEDSNARSTTAAIIRQQQQARRLSCVRWCVLPAADRLDSRANDKLARTDRRGHPRAAGAGDVQRALDSAGGAMSFLELQATVEARALPGRRDTRGESFSELQGACRQLLSPALSQRGPNHLTERLMWARQRLYCRRFARGEPPLLPDPTGSTLVSPRELALLMKLPSLGSEHALPLERNTVPHLPLPTEVARARTVDLPHPPASADDRTEPEAVEQSFDAELVWEEPERP